MTSSPQSPAPSTKNGSSEAEPSQNQKTSSSPRTSRTTPKTSLEINEEAELSTRDFSKVKLQKISTLPEFQMAVDYATLNGIKSLEVTQSLMDVLCREVGSSPSLTWKNVNVYVDGTKESIEKHNSRTTFQALGLSGN